MFNKLSEDPEALPWELLHIATIALEVSLPSPERFGRTDHSVVLNQGYSLFDLAVECKVFELSMFKPIDVRAISHDFFLSQPDMSFHSQSVKEKQALTNHTKCCQRAIQGARFQSHRSRQASWKTKEQDTAFSCESQGVRARKTLYSHVRPRRFIDGFLC